MRSSLLALSLLAIPAALWADDLPVDSEVTSVTVFPQGATLTREGDFAVPAGQHQLILTDMPLIDPASLRLSAPGLTIGAIRYRDDFTPPLTPEVNAAIEAAEAEVERLERAVMRTEAEARQAIRMAVGAASLKIHLPAEIAADMTTRIGEQATQAGFAGRVQILPDSNMQPGDTRVEWDHGMLDFSLSKICDDIIKALTEATAEAMARKKHPGEE